MINLHWANMHNGCGCDVQLYKILSANNNLSTTKQPCTETTDYHENSTRINIKTFPRRNSVQNLARLEIGMLFYNCISKRNLKTLQRSAYDTTNHKNEVLNK